MREVLAGDLAGAYELNFDEIDLVSGATDPGLVASGVAVAGGAVLAVALVSGPIGWTAIGAYYVTMAAAGFMIGYGLS